MALNAVVSEARHLLLRADNSRGEYHAILPVCCCSLLSVFVSALRYIRCHVVAGSVGFAGPRRARTIVCVRPSLPPCPGCRWKSQIHCSTNPAEECLLDRCRILSAVRPLLKGADGVGPAMLIAAGWCYITFCFVVLFFFWSCSVHHAALSLWIPHGLMRND
jgi:hypothetical protein